MTKFVIYVILEIHFSKGALKDPKLESVWWIKGGISQLQSNCNQTKAYHYNKV